jgi:hypothetical protein
MVNTVTAGLIAPAVFHDPRALALAMAAMMATGFVCWRLYRRR